MDFLRVRHNRIMSCCSSDTVPPPHDGTHSSSGSEQTRVQTHERGWKGEWEREKWASETERDTLTHPLILLRRVGPGQSECLPSTRRGGFQSAFNLIMKLVMLSWTHSAHAASNNSNYVWRLMNARWAHLKSYCGACCLWWEDTRCHEYNRVRSADKMMRRNWENLIKGFRWVPTWTHQPTESTSLSWLGEMTSWEKSEWKEICIFCSELQTRPNNILDFPERL